MKEMYLKQNRRQYHTPEVTFVMLETEPGSCLCASVELEKWTLEDSDTGF